MKKSIAVIGLGRFGQAIVRTLKDSKCEVLAIDANQNRVAEAGKLVPHCVICDSTKIEHLQDAGVQNVSHAVICIGKNVQASILTLINLKELGIEKITVRVDADEYVRVMQSLGATEVVYPEKDFGVDFAKRISIKDSNIDNYFELSNGYVQVEFKVNENFTPIKISELKPLSRFEVIVNLIHRNGQILLPDGETEIQPNDTIYAVGKHAKVVKFDDYLNG